MTGVLTSADPTDWKRIGSILGNDRIAEIHITNLLLAEGIVAAIQGSRAYEILVPSGSAERALRVLRSDARKLGYYIGFGTDDVVEAPELKQVIRRTALSSVLRKAKYGGDTALGRFLRSSEISQLTAKYPYVFFLSVHERQYLATPQTYSTGYDVRFELHESARKRADGSRGSCQLLDDGRDVEFHGASEWRFNRS